MANLLLSVDEQDFSGESPSGPFLQIRQETGPWQGQIHAQGNVEGLARLNGLTSQYRFEGLSTTVQALTECVDDLPDLSAIRHLTLSQDLFDPELRDATVLAKFPNLESLTWLSAAPKQALKDVAPQLRFLHIAKAAKTTLKGLENLEGLNVMSGIDALINCPSDGLKSLFLAGFTDGKGALIERFSQLETLSLSSRKSDLSFGFLASLPKFENFAFEGPARQSWGTLPKTLRLVAIEQTNGSAAIADHLSSADVLSLGYNPDDGNDDGVYRGDLLVAGDPFRSINGRYFMDDVI